MVPSNTTLDRLLADLRARAHAVRDVPECDAAAAAAATRRAFSGLAGNRLSVREQRRVEAYFSAVVRRRVIRGGNGRVAASRAVLSTVVADLRSCGFDAERILRELERGWRGRVPDHLLEEVTLQLAS